MAGRFLGAPYPITRDPRGFLRTQEGIDQIKSDLLILLLSNHGERVMLPTFGVNLRAFLFEPNDTILANQIREAISNAITTWEPRVVITSIDITSTPERRDLNPIDPLEDVGNILMIKIEFVDPENIQEIQELVLEVPLPGS